MDNLCSQRALYAIDDMAARERSVLAQLRLRADAVIEFIFQAKAEQRCVGF
jgi:hypothetical protein